MSRSNISIIWDYFDKYDIIDKKAKCRTCCDIYSYKGSTGNLKAHLKKKHFDAFTKIRMAQRETVNIKPKKEQQLTSSEAVNISAGVTSAVSGQALSVNRSTDKKLSNDIKRKIDRDLLDLFIDGYQPFSLVEKRSFKKFAQWIPGYQLPSRETITTVMLPALYEQTKTDLKMILGPDSNHSVCLTVYLWTSTLNETYVTVTGHYITDDLELKTFVLDCRSFQEYSTENIQDMLINVVAEWGLTNKINFAVSNDTANIPKVIQNIGWKQFECYGHALNFIVQDALTTTSVQIILDNVRKVIHLFNTSGTALEVFLTTQTEEKSDCTRKRLVQEVSTHWISTYHMVQRFVELELYIKATIKILKNDFPIITDEEWKALSDLLKVLAPFEQATDIITGENYITGSQVIVITHCLMTTCDKLISEPFDEITKTVISCLITGLRARFGLVEKNRTFSTCTFLDPRYKLSVFSEPDEATNTRNYIQELLTRLIDEEKTQEQSSSSVNNSTNVDGFRAILNKIVGQKSLAVGTPLSNAIKEIDTYINDDPLPIFQEDKLSCPLEWWRDHKYKYPHLSKLVQSYGNIMASSVRCEQIFSKTGHRNEHHMELTSQKVTQLTFLNVNLDQSRFLIPNNE